MTEPTTSWDLYSAWVDVHSEVAMEDEDKWAESYEHFGRMVRDAGKDGILNDIFQETLISLSQSDNVVVEDEDEDESSLQDQKSSKHLGAETFSEIAQRESRDIFQELAHGNNPDPLPIFHNDIISAAASKIDFVGFQTSKGEPLNMSDEESLDPDALDDAAVIISQTELFAIPVLGEHPTVHTLSEREGFTQLVRKSNICHSNSNVILLGAIPAELASEELLNPQKICETVISVKDALLNTAENVSKTPKAGLDETAMVWNANAFSHDVPKGGTRIGGYVLLGAFVSIAPSDEHENLLNLHGPTEEQCDAWEENLQAWIDAQDDKEDLLQCSIGGPSPLREGVAISLADHVYTTMLIQSQMEGKTLSKIDIIVPNDDIDHEDVATVYGYAEDGERVGYARTKALTFGLMMPEITETWAEIAEGCEITVTPTEREVIARNKRKLH